MAKSAIRTVNDAGDEDTIFDPATGLLYERTLGEDSVEVVKVVSAHSTGCNIAYRGHEAVTFWDRLVAYFKA
jgi:hypothetical protein